MSTGDASDTLECAVFRVERREGAYLYVAACDDAGSAASEGENICADQGVSESNSDIQNGAAAIAAEEAAAELEQLPEELLATLGPLTKVMALQLGAARKLAVADVQDVMRSLREKGYYLQLPPAAGATRASANAQPGKQHS